MSREAAEVARRAAEIIQERGKATRTYFDDDGRVCALGAVMDAAAERFGNDMVARVAARQKIDWTATKLVMDADPTVGGLTTWNDRPDTTERDVAKVLLQVADRLDVAP